MVLIIRATFWSSYDEILTLPHYDPKDGQSGHCCRMPPNHRFYLVLLCLSSERHFGAVTVKFSLNPITTQKIANLKNSLTPLNHRFQLAIMGLSKGRHFGDLTMKSSLNSITTQIMTCLQTAVRRFQIISFPLLSQRLSSEQYFAALTVKDGQFSNAVTRLWIVVFS